MSNYYYVHISGYACVMMLVLYVVLVFQVFVSAMGRRRAKSGCMLIFISSQLLVSVRLCQ